MIINGQSWSVFTRKRLEKGNIKSLFKYHIIKNNGLGKLAVQVTLDTDIIDVEGFPLTVFKEDNVNQVVDKNIKKRKWGFNDKEQLVSIR